MDLFYDAINVQMLIKFNEELNSFFPWKNHLEI